MTTFLTYYDFNYLAHGLALIVSLDATMHRLWRILVFHLDAESRAGLERHRRDRGVAASQVKTIVLVELEAVFP